jgi:hypothetical protein
MTLATVIAVTVPVTAQHLAKGRPGRCRECPLALAVVDAIEDAKAAYVHYDSRDGEPADVHADVALADGSTLILGLGPDVARILARIDARKPVEPFSFVAEVLDHYTEREVA